MPYDDPDPQDPMTLDAVAMPASLEDVEAMARGFAEEFAASGWDEDRLLVLFHAPFYAGPHSALLQLGEDRIRTIVTEAVAPWRNAHAQG
jgi:hypothetical protein